MLYGEEGEKAEEYEESGFFYSKDWILCSDESSISYYSSKNEFIMEKEKEEKEIPDFIQIFGNENRKYGGNAIVICNGKNIKVICNPGIIYDDKEKVIDFEYEDEISSIDIHHNYIVVNKSEIIMINPEYYGNAIKLSNLKDVKNIQTINEDFLTEKSFIENENGCFCIEGLTEEERLQLYKDQGFESEYKSLKDAIEEREKERQEEQRRIENEKAELKKYVDSAKSLLVPVFYRNPYDIFDMDGAKICDAKGIPAHGVYYKNDENVEALYGVQEDRFRGRAYRGMIINVEMAKELVRKGKLHLDVPEEDMGKIIGSKGSNINAVTASLRQKGVDISRIILHPKSKEEMEKITLQNIEKAINGQKSKDQEEL